MSFRRRVGLGARAMVALLCAHLAACVVEEIPPVHDAGVPEPQPESGRTCLPLSAEQTLSEVRPYCEPQMCTAAKRNFNVTDVNGAGFELRCQETGPGGGVAVVLSVSRGEFSFALGFARELLDAPLTLATLRANVLSASVHVALNDVTSSSEPTPPVTTTASLEPFDRESFELVAYDGQRLQMRMKGVQMGFQKDVDTAPRPCLNGPLPLPGVCTSGRCYYPQTDPPEATAARVNIEAELLLPTIDCAR